MFENKWTIENIRHGITLFHKENGRYPTAEDFDSYPYLPSARQVQRRFGGLINLRKYLGYNTFHYGIGDIRSKVANEIGRKGLIAERRIEEELIKHFGEYFVHAEKPLYKYFKSRQPRGIGKTRADFLSTMVREYFVSTFLQPEISFSLKRVINIKLNNYSGLSIKTYFVNGGVPSPITKEEIEEHIGKKSKRLESNMVILNESDFIEEVSKYKPIRILG